MMIVDFSERPFGTNHTGPCYVFTTVIEKTEVNNTEELVRLFQQKLEEFVDNKTKSV